jgi:hypothetical protein
MNFFKKLIAAKFIESTLGKLSHDSKTTILGVLAGALLAGNVDFGKLITGDVGEISKAVASLVVAAFGYYTNKKEK